MATVLAEWVGDLVMFAGEALDLLRHITEASSCREYGPTPGVDAPCILQHAPDFPPGFEPCWHCAAVSLIADTEAGRFRGLFEGGEVATDGP